MQQILAGILIVMSCINILFGPVLIGKKREGYYTVGWWWANTVVGSITIYLLLTAYF